MSAPKVSIIIPVYNGAPTLGQCLQSVLNQSNPAFEVIVVDNNSIDQTKDIAIEFQSDYPNIQYVFEPLRSRGAARNAGIIAAHGEIIVMTDSDCIVPYNWIESLIAPIVNEGETIVMGHEYDLNKNFWSKSIQEANQSFFGKYLNGNYITVLDTKNFAITTDTMKQFMFNPSVGNIEDFELSIRLRDKVKIRYIPSIKVGHYHKNSLVSWFKLNFNRGYWAGIVFHMHKEKEFIHNDTMFESRKLTNLIKLPFWMALQLLKNPSKKIGFIFLTEISWRAGLYWGRKC